MHSKTYKNSEFFLLPSQLVLAQGLLFYQKRIYQNEMTEQILAFLTCINNFSSYSSRPKFCFPNKFEIYIPLLLLWNFLSVLYKFIGCSLGLNGRSLKRSIPNNFKNQSVMFICAKQWKSFKWASNLCLVRRTMQSFTASKRNSSINFLK